MRRIPVEYSSPTDPPAVGERRLLEMVASGRPVRDVLEALCRHVETRIVPGCRCGVYLVDAQRRRLQAVAGPRVQAPSHWSMPIRRVGGEVIGTLTIMQSTSAHLTRSQFESLASLSRLAGIAHTIAHRSADPHPAEALAAAACMAHEISQPLSGIVTNAGLCVRLLSVPRPDGRTAREAARRLLRDATRAAQVVAAVRTLFSRKDPQASAVNLNAAARDVIASMTDRFKGAKVLLHTEFATDLPLIAGDRVQLEQVITNLLLNACDAMMNVGDRPRRLLVRSALGSQDRVVFSVTDSGEGLHGPIAERLFQPFKTTRTQGMGIGLFLSRCIIESHQGELNAAPNDGPGATFSFSVPPLQHAIAGSGE